jgi:DNA polymerase III alpha subunit
MLATTLNNRTLWADGVSEVEPDQVIPLLERGVPAALIACEPTPDIIEFNAISDAKIKPKLELNSSCFPPAWVIPDKYKYLDLAEHLIGLAERIEQDELYEKRLLRLTEEISIFLELGYDDLLRALIYVVDELEANRVVWGVGRGSSCSSYLLYLLGLHEVDSVRYEIPFSDFIKDPKESSNAKNVPISPR